MGYYMDKVLLQLEQAEKLDKICDIGGGAGRKAKIIADKFNSEVWIIEGSTENNHLKENHRKAKWNVSAKNFSYYWLTDNLIEKQKGIFGQTKHTLVDADNLDIAESIKFDLISSFLSCGFHYPLNTYYDFIRKHRHEKTKYLFDLRVRNNRPYLPAEVKIKDTLYECYKFHTCELEFNI